MADAFGVNSTEYSLKWNSHHSTIVNVLDSLLEKESLVDVTLAAEGKFINVHRFMLFACSPYFEVTFFLYYSSIGKCYNNVYLFPGTIDAATKEASNYLFKRCHFFQSSGINSCIDSIL